MIAGLVLAAGESSRMGRDKALLVYRGRTFLEGIVDTLRRAKISRIVVVLGHHAREIDAVARRSGAEVVVNPHYRAGQTSSLKTGIRFLGGSAEAIVLCLVDHPAASPRTVRALVSAFRESPRAGVIPAYQGRRGHPCLIGRPLLQEILSLGPDEGANAVVRRHGDAVLQLDVDDPGILIDVDDPKTYSELPPTALTRALDAAPRPRQDPARK